MMEKPMLTAYRRHLTRCPHRTKGQHFSLCTCPIWGYGLLGERRFRQSLRTSDWPRALHRIEILQQGGALVDGEFQKKTAPPTGPLLRETVALYLKSCEGRHLKAETLRGYRHHLGCVAEVLGDQATSSITVPLLDDYRATRKLAAGSWRKELIIMRSFFQWAMDRQWLANNPAMKLTLPRIEELVTLPLDHTEIESLIQATYQIASKDSRDTPYVQKRARALVYTLAYSGLRVSDVTVLKRSAIDADGYLTLKVLKTGVRQKLQLNRKAQDALDAMPAIHPEYYFWTGRGEPTTCTKHLWRIVHRLGVLAGIHAHPHRFRDTFAVELLSNGIAIHTVQQLLGHKSVQTTEKHYAHFVAAHQQILDAATATLNFFESIPPAGRCS